MTRLTMAVLAMLLLSPCAFADVVELKTGQRVEGKLRHATPAGVEIDIAGQNVRFPAENVRAIYFGSAPLGQMAPAAGPLAPVRAMASATKSGITYRDYAPRVVDARVKVDEVTKNTPDQARTAIVGAMRLYELASRAWSYQINEPIGGFVELAQTVESDEMMRKCPTMGALIEKGNAQAHKMNRVGIERLRVVGIEIGFNVPAIWSCAADKIAEAEKLLTPSR
jgi:hypothetical protein